MKREDVLAHYCLTRADLPHGVQAAQLIHAAGESSPGKLPPRTHAYALVTTDEDQLKQIGWELFKNGISHRLIFEPDAPYTGQLMAIGVTPRPRSEVKGYFSALKLLK